jgi:hypothetical protein
MTTNLAGMHGNTSSVGGVMTTNIALQLRRKQKKTDRVSTRSVFVQPEGRRGVYAALISTRLARASGAIGAVMLSIPL